MGKHPNNRLQGTLDLLVLKSLAARGPIAGASGTTTCSCTQDAICALTRTCIKCK
jgi:hypothetical protein